jgi:hypothetical protein
LIKEVERTIWFQIFSHSPSFLCSSSIISAEEQPNIFVVGNGGGGYV